MSHTEQTKMMSWGEKVGCAFLAMGNVVLFYPGYTFCKLMRRLTGKGKAYKSFSEFVDDTANNKEFWRNVKAVEEDNKYNSRLYGENVIYKKQVKGSCDGTGLTFKTQRI